ncbi:MAG: type II secretion system protein [Aquabacterium sp.]|nr:type II secretion system protein [Aquabacterium sp.]
MPRQRQATCQIRCIGFTYIGVLALVAILALVGTAAVRVGLQAHRRLAEQALLQIGAEFSDALGRYAAVTPRGASDAPKSLEELLLDPRFPGTVRHLRRIYNDPLTGSKRWGLVFSEDGEQLVGVYSLARGTPIRAAGFDERFAGFNAQAAYSAWVFTRPAGAGARDGTRAHGLVSGATVRVDNPVADAPAETEQEVPDNTLIVRRRVRP